MSELQIPSRLVFRVPQISILAALLVAICATPMAAAQPAFLALYAIPISIIVWVVRVRTTADADGLVVRSVVGRRSLAWDDLKGLLLSRKGGVAAVLADESRVELPSVRVRHLPALSLISGGRITDPTEPVPGEPVPAEPVPAEPAPTEPAPTEAAPSETASAKATSAKAVPKEAAPVKDGPAPSEPGPAAE
ncbi:PH domain-containing protein [Actinokineospora sp. 24-640]